MSAGKEEGNKKDSKIPRKASTIFNQSESCICHIYKNSNYILVTRYKLYTQTISTYVLLQYTQTYSSDIKVVDSGTLEPFSEKMLLNAGLSLKDG